MANIVRRKSMKVQQDRGIKIAFTVIFAIFSAILLFPFFWIILNSFKEKTEFDANTWSLPSIWLFKNYSFFFSVDTIDFSFIDMFKNTIILCLIVPTCGQVSTILAAYVMAKYKFKGQKILYAIYIIPMLVSITGTVTSTFLLLEKMGMIGNFWGIIVMSCGGTGFNFLMMFSLFKGVNDAYMESARIDGAGHFRTFIQIMLPHVMGLVGTMWILGFIGVWNDFTTPAIFLGEDYYTIATGVQKIGTFVEESAEYPELMNNYPVYFASIIISLLPVVIIFLIFQKPIMKMSLGGGIK